MGSDQHDIDRAQLDEGSPGADRKRQLPPEVSALWYSLRARPWRTLALVAPGNGPGAWRLAQKFQMVEGEGTPALKLVNALDASVGRVSAVAHALSRKKLEPAPDRARFILAADSPLENPVAIGLLSTCDAVLLLLERQRTRIPDAQRILELIGPERFIGAVLAPG